VNICTDDLDPDDVALLDRLEAGGRVVMEYEDEMGYGHHTTAYIVEMGGSFYAAESSGCSCGGSGNVNGPYSSKDEAILAIGSCRSDLKEVA
jgi:hypothetical protein